LVVFLKRPGSQAQFSEALSLQAADDRFGVLHNWISKHLADDLSLTALAKQAGMSERSFSRHYAKATGLTPAHAIERLRVEGARRLLSETRLPVKRISQRCGFGSERDDAPQLFTSAGRHAAGLQDQIQLVTSVQPSGNETRRS
jgi:transcriptional regulator GlxA family with amidase domain